MAHPPHLEYLECRLLGSDCQVQPQVHLGGGHITRTSGKWRRRRPWAGGPIGQRAVGGPIGQRAAATCALNRVVCALLWGAARRQLLRWPAGRPPHPPPCSGPNHPTTRPAGFPIPYQPLNATGYQSVAGQGPAGGELKGCSGSVVPGGCAFGSVRDALALCSSMPTCRSVVYYHRGEAGCS